MEEEWVAAEAVAAGEEAVVDVDPSVAEEAGTTVVDSGPEGSVSAPVAAKKRPIKEAENVLN